MKLGLIGYGKMNKLVEKFSSDTIVEITRDYIKDFSADLYIDFSNAALVEQNGVALAERGKRHVIGTTGWKSNKLRAAVERHGSAALYSPNFSLDVARFFLLLEEAKKLFGLPTKGSEQHHKSKADAPSGTAKKIEELYGIRFDALRTDEVCFKHTVEWETISITHAAKNRDGYAKGALAAAHWLADKRGWYTLDDMLRSLHTADHAFSR
ncbi:MAG: hypothetical protein H7A36_05350 [Chlamydiales bacterium]|nr:hypothetical protein [Chlamydiales bacterium]